jgi:hypothetical protein
VRPFDLSFEFARTTLTDHTYDGTIFRRDQKSSSRARSSQLFLKSRKSSIQMLRSSGRCVSCPPYSLLKKSPNNSWAISIMWFVTSFAGMTWATYAAFCEPPNPFAQTTDLDCWFPQTAEGSCTCIPCRVWLWDLSAFSFVIQYLNCYFGGCFKLSEARPAFQLAWRLSEISTSWRNEEPRWESLSA